MLSIDYYTFSIDFLLFKFYNAYMKLNRATLKIIALITMLVDHIGWIFFPEILVFRIIGRLSFPIYAYFIAHGFFHTRSKKKYLLIMLLFAVISYLPYALLAGWFKLNILFTFLFACLFIVLIEKLKEKETKDFTLAFLAFGGLLLLFLTLLMLGAISYGVLGTLLVILLYYLRENKLHSILATAVVMLGLTAESVAAAGFTLLSVLQIFSLLSLPLLAIYDNQKGSTKGKYLFYIFYPAHLLIIYLCTLFL